MARAPLTLGDRLRGLLLGLAGASTRATAGPGAAGEAALAIQLTEELLEERVDPHRLVSRWTTGWREDGRGLDARTIHVFEHLVRTDAPAPPGPGIERGAPIPRLLPLGAALAAMPRSLVSGTWHLAMLTHPDPTTAWSAAAVNVAAAALVRGRRDFLPDVIEALDANDAPQDLRAALRRIPFIGAEALRARSGAGDPDAAVAVAETALWQAHHAPPWRGGPLPDVGPSALADLTIAGLCGLRDGEAGLPEAWRRDTPARTDLRRLARRVSARIAEPRRAR